MIAKIRIDPGVRVALGVGGVLVLVEDDLVGQGHHHLHPRDVAHQAQVHAEAAVDVLGQSAGIQQLERRRVGASQGIYAVGGNAGGALVIGAGSPGLGFHIGAAQQHAGADGLDLAQVDVELDTAVQAGLGVADSAAGGPHGIHTGRMLPVNVRIAVAVQKDALCGRIVIGVVQAVFGVIAEAVAHIVPVGYHAGGHSVGEAQVEADFRLAVGGVLEGVVAFHLGHAGVVHHHLLAHVGGQVDGGLAVHIFGFRIQMGQTGRLIALAPATAQGEPGGQLEGAVEARRHALHLLRQSRLQHIQAHAGLQLELNLVRDVPGEIVFQIGRQLVQRGNIVVRTRPAVAVGTQGLEHVVVVETAGLVALQPVFGAHIEALVQLAGADVEHIAHLGVEAEGAGDGSAAGAIGIGDVGHLIIAVGERGDHGHSAARRHNAGGAALVIGIAQADGVVQGAGELLVEGHATLVGEAEGGLLLGGLGAFHQQIGILLAQIDDAAEVELGGGAPDAADGLGIGDAAADTVVGAVFHAGVAGSAGIVGIHIDAAGLVADLPAFAQGGVQGGGIHFGAHFPGGVAGLGVHHHGAGGEVSVFGRGNAADHFHGLDVVGTDLAQVHAGTAGAAAHFVGEGGVVRHRHAIHHNGGAEGIVGGALVQRADGELFLRGHIGRAHQLAGQQLHNVLEAGGLQVVDGHSADAGGGGGPGRAGLGRYHHFFQGQAGLAEGDGEGAVLAEVELLLKVLKTQHLHLHFGLAHGNFLQGEAAVGIRDVIDAVVQEQTRSARHGLAVGVRKDCQF